MLGFTFTFSVASVGDLLKFFTILFCIMHSAFNLFVFPNSMFTPLLLLLFFYMKGL